nr:alpha/beta hydrolase [Sulfitobacter faviae]
MPRGGGAACRRLWAFPLVGPDVFRPKFHSECRKRRVVARRPRDGNGAALSSGQDAESPRASPILADFNGAPPVWLTVSDSEILRDDSRRLAARLREAGVSASLQELHDLPHVWPLFQNHLPEARQSLAALADWINALPPDRAGES